MSRFPDPHLHPRLVVIGDVHGCLQELEALLVQVGPRAGDRFVFLGDLVDRGPESPGVVARVRTLLAEHPGSLVILGNHEAKLRRRTPEWTALLGEGELDWLRTLPLYARDHARGLVFVHGGFFPRYFERHGQLPKNAAALDRVPKKQRERAERFTMIRHVDARGEMVGLGHEGPDTRCWAEGYDGGEGFACFGHQPLLDAPRWYPHAVALDGACAFGGALLAAVWGEPGTGRPVILRQPALQAYAELRGEA
jgi:diadenosine tetraphosphatase ApaH/serine/threonine PP2A family protein phosphatase